MVNKLTVAAIQMISQWSDSPEKIIEKLQSKEGKEIYESFLKKEKENTKR